MGKAVTANFRQLFLIFDKSNNYTTNDEVNADDVYRVLTIYGVPGADASKALEKFTTWQDLLETYDLFGRKVSNQKELVAQETTEQLNTTKRPPSTTPSQRPASAVKTLLSHKSLTLSQISTVKSGTTTIVSNATRESSNGTRETIKRVRIQNLILQGWKDLSKSITASSSPDDDIGSMAFDDFIGLFNQFVVRGGAGVIENQQVLEDLYNCEEPEIIPWLVLSGLLLNRPIGNVLLANKLWIEDMAAIPMRSKVRLLANPRFSEALIYLRRQLRKNSHSNCLKLILRRCRTIDISRNFSLPSNEFQKILSDIVCEQLSSEHMFYIILFYDRGLTGKVPYLQFYNDFK